jgi:hypothetical protein
VGQSGEGLTAEEQYILDLVLERGTISDASISLQDLERIKMQEFGEILPMLESLVARDLLQRLPSDLASDYGPTPLLSREKKTGNR